MTAYFIGYSYNANNEKIADGFRFSSLEELMTKRVSEFQRDAHTLVTVYKHDGRLIYVTSWKP